MLSRPSQTIAILGVCATLLLAPLVTRPLLAATDTVPTARIAPFSGDRAAAISYTFDDGLRDQYTLAVPMLNEFGLKGTFFVIPGATPETKEEAEKNNAKRRAWGGISWGELKEIAATGHEIASHTWSHPNLTKLAPEQIEEQIGKASQEIEKRIGQKPLTLAFPFNADTPEIQAVALQTHLAFRDYQLGIGGKTTVESLRKWADEQVRGKKWGVAMFHGIGSGYAALSDPEIFRAHLKEMRAREGEIWVATFADVARYKKERENAKISVSGRDKNLICALTSSLDPQIYNVPLTLVIEAKGVKSARARRGPQEIPVRIATDTLSLDAVPDSQPILLSWK